MKGDLRATEHPVVPSVVLGRDSRHATCLHEGHQLVVSGIEEDVTDLSAFLDLEDVAAHRLEPEDALVEVARPVQVQGREADVREPSGGHDVSSLAGSIPAPTARGDPSPSPSDPLA